jgi:hypothetical protein
MDSPPIEAVSRKRKELSKEDLTQSRKEEKAQTENSMRIRCVDQPTNFPEVFAALRLCVRSNCILGESIEESHAKPQSRKEEENANSSQYGSKLYRPFNQPANLPRFFA